MSDEDRLEIEKYFDVVRADPDEARLPECVCKHMRTTSTEGYAINDRERCLDCGEERMTTWGDCRAPAILLATSAGDAEVLRAGTVRSEGSPQFWDALDRARIVDASTHVCLPRAEVEALLARPRSTYYFALAAWIDELAALLSRETGKGEG